MMFLHKKDPASIRRIRTSINIVLWILLAGILLLNYHWLAKLYTQLF